MLAAVLLACGGDRSFRRDGGMDAAAASDAAVSDAAGSDARSTIDSGPGGACQGAALEFCDTPADCAAVLCTCSCAGCGGFDYDDIVNLDCVDDWYAQAGCEPATLCLEVCCAPTIITCVDHVCGASSGAP